MVTPGIDIVSSIGKGPQGTVYTTGVKSATGGYGKLFVCKYSPAGRRLWQRTYDGPSHLGAAGNELAVDGRGRVTIAGSLMTPTVGADDILVRKYSAAGALLWSRRFGGTSHLNDTPRDIALDGNGNACVVGSLDQIDTGLDMVEYKLRAGDGQRMFTFTHNSGEPLPNTASDEASAVALDAHGNSYLTGTRHLVAGGNAACTVSVSPHGALRWEQLVYDGGPLVPGASGNDIAVKRSTSDVYVTGSMKLVTTHFMFFLTKYTGAGAYVWSNGFGGTTTDDDGSALTLDSAGKVVVIGGHSDPVAGETNARAARFEPSTGAALWSSWWAPSPPAGTGAWTMTTDGANNVYIGGWIDTGADDGFGVVKFGSDGTFRWQYTLDGTGAGSDVCRSLVFSGGAVYAGGHRVGAASGYNGVLVKIKP